MIEEPTDFGVQCDVIEEIAVARVSGELDVATAPELRDTLIRIIDNGYVRIVLDMAGVAFIDSTGLGVLTGMLHRLRPHDGALVVAGPSPAVRNALHLTHLDQVLAVHDSLPDAIAAINTGRASTSP
jgi:anti-sigma B factor antagonist